ncbi:MAG: Fur family transcriptional regulator [Gaiellaceae bacterium]|jgi:Fur family ferric uptake transcriptional regulator
MQEAAQVGEPELVELLAQGGVRATRQRLEVLGELAREPDDATAQTLWRRLRERKGSAIGLATVYRTLSLLSEKGVIDALSHHDGELCYRLCGEAHHHHLVCSSCHRVVEIQECELDDWLSRVSAQHGFVTTSHTIELTGLCPTCRS